MKISIIIPAYNEENYIGECLDHIIRYAGTRAHEIIVADNASTDRTVAIASSKPGVKIVSEKNKGANFARQKGLETSTGDYVAYLDADSRMPADWLDKAEKLFENGHKDMVSLSGPYKYYDGTWWQRMIMSIFWHLTTPTFYRIVGYMTVGGNFIVKKSAMETIGGFEKSIGFYGDDTDTARRLSKVGKVIFNMDFFTYSSIRRFAAEGLLKTNATYAINFFWIVFFHRPFSRSYKDIRSVL